MIAEAERIAAEAFGVRGAVTQLPGERDLNFRVGPDHVLKLHPPGADRARLELETAALAHLARTTLPVPRAIGARPLADVTVAGTVGWAARMLTWLDGRPWASAGGQAVRLGALGRLVAQVDGALADFEHPAMDRPLRWNLVLAGEQAALLEYVADAALRAWAAAVLERFDAAVAPRLQELPWQLLHNDANDHNVLLASDGTPVGLIDFGDLACAPRVCGLAIACAYAMLGRTRPVAAAAHVVGGYHVEAPLGALELELLWDLIAARLAVSVCMAAWQSARDPENEYLLVSQADIAALVDVLGHERAELAHFRFRDACGFEPNPAARAVRSWLAITPAADPLADAPIAAGGRHHAPSEGGEDVQLGVVLATSAGTLVRAPLDGTIASDGEGSLVLEHRTPDGTPFWSRFGGATATARGRVGRGDAIGRAADDRVHVQLLTALAGDAPARARLDELELWDSVSPDPNLLLRRPEGVAATVQRDAAALAERRRPLLSGALSLSYREPLHIVAGRGARLIAADGREYVDLVNNVCHVGHCHPRVVAAAQRQIETLNTNTRYLHDAIVTYGRRLAAMLPDPLSVVFLVNSGSEANDLALRLARAHTRRRETLVLEHAYHGTLSSLIEISPYKFAGPGGAGPGDHVRVCALPDPYRGRFGADVTAYVEDVARQVEGPTTFIAESLPGVAGQIVLPDGYLAGAYAHVRAAGGVCIADEVQVGFGRVGDAFWAFELQGVVPDIVTLGKPIGNGHPLAAVVTTPAIARSFETGMEYFNTFGGNPVSCATGLAVLDVIQDEGLQARARRLGGELIAALSALASRHAAVGDVRGRGLFVGVEIVSDRERRTPDAATASALVEYCRHQGFLASTDGPWHNVLKLKPPLVVSESDLERFVAVLDAALTEAT